MSDGTSRLLVILGLVLFVGMPYTGVAQKEGNLWYLQGGQGLNFNTIPPTILEDGVRRADEGEAFTMADPCGNLLFYSNGFRVWNREHRVMQNGDSLLGGQAIQPVMAVPYPGNDSLYYLFTQNIRALAIPPYAELRYSVIDMRLDGGNGAITTKNQFLYQTNANSLTALRHANGKDYWVLTVEGETNRFLAYLVDVNGLQTVPVVSLIPYQFIYSRKMRASPDGRYIATNTFTNLPNSIEYTLLDFDATTGRVTNTRLIPVTDNQNNAMDFSPDSQKLYWNVGFSQTQVAQFQLSQGSGEEIAATRYNIPGSQTQPGVLTNDIRLGPDGKVYVARGLRAVDVIENPNATGSQLQYRQPAYTFSEAAILPNNLAGLSREKRTDFVASPVCADAPVQFQPQLTYRAVQQQWDFGDPASGEANVSALPNPAHQFSAPGSYLVQLIALDLCGERDTVQKPVAVYPEPFADIPEERVEKCFNEVPVTFTTPELPLTQYRWNTGDTSRSISAIRTGWYVVEAYNPCGSQKDSVYLDVTPEAIAYLPDDTIVCEGNFAVLDARNPGASYQWNTGETTQTIQVDQPGKYYVEIRNRCSQAIDTANLVFIREDVGAFIPNVFTPNGDGVNDTFELYVLNTPAYRLTIANRWGTPVYTSSDPFAGWDGRVNGEEAAPGVYFWLVSATDCRGDPKTFRGTVHLLR